jgi:prepilin-type processing-associated H-X9-DG protein
MLGEATGDGISLTATPPGNPHIAGTISPILPNFPAGWTAVSTPAWPSQATPLTFHWPVQYKTPVPVPAPAISTMMVSAHPGKVIVLFFDGHVDSVTTETVYPQ